MKANLLPVLKMAAIVAALTFLGFAIIAGTEWYRYRQSDEYRALQELKKLEEQYRNDPYGGSTPEETLSLFIEALKKNDMELASKYFPIEEREKQKIYLDRIKSANQIEKLLKNLVSAQKNKTSSDGDIARFKYEENFSGGLVNIGKSYIEVKPAQIAQYIELSYYPQNKKWKITGF